MTIDIQRLRDALRMQPSDAEVPDEDVFIEKLGEPAFDWIAREVRTGSLAPNETVRALRLLARMSRQFCLGRKGELVDLAMAVCQDETADLRVRSTAAHIAAANGRIAARLVRAHKHYGRSTAAFGSQVRQALTRAG